MSLGCVMPRPSCCHCSPASVALPTWVAYDTLCALVSSHRSPSGVLTAKPVLLLVYCCRRCQGSSKLGLVWVAKT